MCATGYESLESPGVFVDCHPDPGIRHRRQHHHLQLNPLHAVEPCAGLGKTGEMVSLSLGQSAQNAFPFTYPDYEAMRDGQHSFSGITAYLALAHQPDGQR